MVFQTSSFALLASLLKCSPHQHAMERHHPGSPGTGTMALVPSVFTPSGGPGKETRNFLSSRQDNGFFLEIEQKTLLQVANGKSCQDEIDKIVHIWPLLLEIKTMTWCSVYLICVCSGGETFCLAFFCHRKAHQLEKSPWLLSATSLILAWVNGKTGRKNWTCLIPHLSHLWDLPLHCPAS